MKFCKIFLGFLYIIGVVFARTIYTDILGDSLLTWKNDTSVSTVNTRQVLDKVEVLGIYFSGSWCQPCKRFTPVLVTFYERMKLKNKKFEIILVSYDRTEEDFLKYYHLMPWLSLTLENIPIYGNKMSEMYGIEGIPSLVLLEGSDLSVITLDGTSKVSADTYGVEFPWRSRRVSSLMPKPVHAFMKRNYEAISTRLSDVSPSTVLRKTVMLPTMVLFKAVEVLKLLIGSVFSIVKKARGRRK